MLENVNATRMELLRLRKRVGLATRGHRLLSQKRDEICRQLVKIAQLIKPLRDRVEKDLLETTRRFMMARATMEPEDMTAAMEIPTKKFSLTISFARIMSVKVPRLAKEIAGDIEAKDVLGDAEVAKVSIVGAGMRSHAGVASQMFETLSNEDINIAMISTSEIKVSCVIDVEHTEKAVQVLHTAFGLGAKDAERERL